MENFFSTPFWPTAYVQKVIIVQIHTPKMHFSSLLQFCCWKSEWNMCLRASAHRLCFSSSQRNAGLRPLKYCYSFQFPPFLWAPFYKGQDRGIYMSPALMYIIFVQLANNKWSQWPWHSDRSKPYVWTVFPSEKSVLWLVCWCFFFFFLGNCPSTSCHGQ